MSISLYFYMIRAEQILLQVSLHNGLRIVEWAVVSLAAAYVRLEPAHNVS